MKLEFEDVFEKEDFDTINRRERFDKELTIEEVKLSKDVPIVIRYDYADLKDTEYNFWQECTHEDTIGYFTKMKLFAGKSINSMLNDDREHHFHRSELRGNVRNAIKRILPKSIDTNQLVYHFALYDDKDRWADRATETRCSRVYFMLGSYGHVYILFFDPYHELNPILKTK